MTNISGIKSVSSSIKYWMCHVKKQINAILLNMNIYTSVDPFVFQFYTTNTYFVLSKVYKQANLIYEFIRLSISNDFANR